MLPLETNEQTWLARKGGLHKFLWYNVLILTKIQPKKHQMINQKLWQDWPAHQQSQLVLMSEMKLENWGCLLFMDSNSVLFNSNGLAKPQCADTFHKGNREALEYVRGTAAQVGTISKYAFSSKMDYFHWPWHEKHQADKSVWRISGRRGFTFSPLYLIYRFRHTCKVQ